MFRPAKRRGNLSELKHLTLLSLSWSGIGDDGLLALGVLPRLQLLRLAETRVTDAGLAHLKSFRQLYYLVLAGTKTTEKGLEALRNAVPGLESDMDLYRRRK